MESDTLLIRNANILCSNTSTSILIEKGEIAGIGDDLSGAGSVIDADGGLVTPTFVDCHTHLDKAMVFDEIDDKTGTLQEAIRVMRDRKKQYTKDDVRKRAEEAIKLHLKNGCNQIRTHVDIDKICGLTGLEGVKEARDTYKEEADIEIAAFPQEGLMTKDGSEDLIKDALDNGADVVGGIPALEESAELEKKHIDMLLEIADSYDVPVDMHIDENDDPDSRTLEYLATRTKEMDLDDGRVTASHACALSTYPESHAKHVISLLEDANINVVTNPTTNLLLLGREDNYPKRRGTTRIDQLHTSNVTVAAGQDNMQDGFYPYGQANMLEVAWLLSHVAHLDSRPQQKDVIDMVTEDASKILENSSKGLSKGADANLNIFHPRIKSITAALRESPQPRYNIYNGDIIDP